MAQREIIVRAYFGEIGVNREDYDLLNVLLEPLEEMYGCVNVNDKIVIDIGAYIGDTALYFIHRGARKVYVFEPVEKFYRYLLRNIARNNLEDRIIAFNYGAWFRDTVIRTNIMGELRGLE